VTSFTEYDYGWMRHINIVEYLKEFLHPQGFYLKHSGFGDYEYFDEYHPGSVGGPGEYRDSFASIEDYDYSSPDVFNVTGISFVLPGCPVDVEFDYHLESDELTVCVNSAKVITSEHRTGRRNQGPYVGKFNKEWRDRDIFEKEFESWFRDEGLRLLELEGTS
jgi:hypothetical protein